MAKIFLSRADNIEVDIQEALKFLDWGKTITQGDRVFLKPNLTYPSYKPGVTTSPEFVEAVIKVISSRTRNIMVGEADGGFRGWPVDMAFRSHGLPEICKKYNARLVNLSKEPCVSLPMELSKGKIDLSLPAVLLQEVDVFITLPVPKIHAITHMSGAIKNQWGCIPDAMRLIFHPYFDELILEINRLLKVRLALADGKYFLNKNGPMINGIPVLKNMVIGSESIGAMDAALCRIMGLKRQKIRYLKFAEQNGWIPPDEEVVVNRPPEDFFEEKFYLKRTLRNHIVVFAFDRPWAVKLIWNSKFGNLLHKILYLFSGNPVADSVRDIMKKG